MIPHQITCKPFVDFIEGLCELLGIIRYTLKEDSVQLCLMFPRESILYTDS